MLPSKIVGSVTTSGREQPFVLDVATGKVALGSFGEPDPLQGQMAPDERAASERQVKAMVKGASAVRLGSYRCPDCGASVDVIREPARWSGDRCAACG